MYQHGYFDLVTRKWFCSYFMDTKEWMEIHDYMPTFEASNLSDDDSEDRIVG